MTCFVLDYVRPGRWLTRRTQDADLAAEAVAELAGMIRRSRAQVWETGGLLLWDWYEIATRIQQDIEGQISER